MVFRGKGFLGGSGLICVFSQWTPLSGLDGEDSGPSHRSRLHSTTLKYFNFNFCFVSKVHVLSLPMSIIGLG